MGARHGGYRGAVPELRRARASDLDAVVDLLTLRSRAAFGIAEVDRAHVEHAWSLDGTETWVAADGDALVGYAELGSSQAIDVAAREPAVGDELLVSVEARARERGFGFVASVVAETDEPLCSLVERGGFDHLHDVLRMWRRLDGDLPEPRLVDDVAVRAYRADDAERVHAFLDDAYLAWDTTYVPLPHGDWLRWMTEHDDFDPELWFVAERDGELVACALHWRVHQRRGWVKDIAVRADQRGRGLAKALLHHGFRAYSARGAEQVGLKVESANPTGAVQLYERVGFVTDRRYGIWQKRL